MTSIFAPVARSADRWDHQRMSIVDKAKGLAAQAIHKAEEVAGEVREKAGPLAEKAGDVAAKGVSAASAGANKVTGGRFEDKIGHVTEKVEGVLHQDKKGEPGTEPGPAPKN
ncbi:hypothetical protein DMC64_11420 [Amycolatopsis sp. WAC 04197]|nr:hypothetical protein DMC64_11420 [Amycolatopsis sp. WAC 04197]